MAKKTPTTAMIHVFIVCFPAQGQINPLLRLGKRLASTGGFLVTFATTSDFGQNIINSAGIVPGEISPVDNGGFLRFDFFDDEWAHTEPRNRVAHLYYPQLELAGRKWVPRMIERLAEEGHPVCCLINGSLFSWVSDIAGELGLLNATMWAQSCASFLSFYHYYNQLVPFPTVKDPYIDVEIPSLPLLKWDELHSLLHPFYPRPYEQDSWVREFRSMHKPFCILIDTFNELEHDIIEFTSKLCPIIKPVGPLFKGTSVDLLRGDLLKADYDCLEWLDTKPRSSVAYICFGSLVHLKQEQIDEIAHGILNIGVSFLWVMKSPEPHIGSKKHTLPVALIEKLGDTGRVVEFTPQEHVLAHPSIACFVTHCGWNSTMEALTLGVPIVAFPQWGDQLTNAKLLVDVYGVGVRMGRGHLHDKVVPREGVERCIREATVGPKAEAMRRNALAWKDKAYKAYQQGGSSDRNLEDFVNEIRRS